MGACKSKPGISRAPAGAAAGEATSQNAQEASAPEGAELRSGGASSAVGSGGRSGAAERLVTSLASSTSCASSGSAAASSSRRVQSAGELPSLLPGTQDDGEEPSGSSHADARAADGSRRRLTVLDADEGGGPDRGRGGAGAVREGENDAGGDPAAKTTLAGKFKKLHTRLRLPGPASAAAAGSGGGRATNGPAEGRDEEEEEDEGEGGGAAVASLTALVHQVSLARSGTPSLLTSDASQGRLALTEEDHERSGAELLQQIRREKSLPVAVEEGDPVATRARSFKSDGRSLSLMHAPSDGGEDSMSVDSFGPRRGSLSRAGSRSGGAVATPPLFPPPRFPLPISREDVWQHPELLTADLFLTLFTPPTAALRCCVLGVEAKGRQESYDDKFTDQAMLPANTPLASVQKTLGFAYACKKGLKPDSPNQDDFGVLCCDSFGLFGVFDGHGPSGHDVSDYVHRLLFFLLLTDENFQKNTPQAIGNAFLATHRSVLAYAAGTELFDCSLSGSTASLVLHTRHRLFVAHVGDSRVVLARQHKSGIVAETITLDHKPTTPAERERIEASGGEVKRLECDIPYRVFVKRRLYPGLAMSRAIGDAIASQIGVTCEPDVTTVELDRSCLFLIMASDGVWEFISSQEAVQIAYGAMGSERKGRTKAAADRLTLEAFKRWVEEEGSVVDDITCQVVWLR
ncbi:putative PP2C [Besnoitia besnoiti]|uniref:Putative PP2C n=1 Tax=Besnoitia besnoiti TaxID=94643 RepID=A0A2A9M5S2_BESBE|nr:putative PP2C [Besnoitia besnoiti]PFH31236.1 putative PP2C [Besnoitia besnoiti]